MNWMDKLLSTEDFEQQLDYTDREATALEFALAMDIAANEVPAPSADGQATNEGGGKAVPARPTLTGCDWLRSEGVLDELPN